MIKKRLILMVAGVMMVDILQTEITTYHYLTDVPPIRYAFRLIMDAKCGLCKPEGIKMVNEMVERVAKALVKANHNNPNQAVDFGMTGFNFMWQLYINDAKAAIAAMREPLKQIIDRDFEVQYPDDLKDFMIKGRKDFRKNLIKSSIDKLGEE